LCYNSQTLVTAHARTAWAASGSRSTPSFAPFSHHYPAAYRLFTLSQDNYASAKLTCVDLLFTALPAGRVLFALEHRFVLGIVCTYFLIGVAFESDHIQGMFACQHEVGCEGAMLVARVIVL